MEPLLSLKPLLAVLIPLFAVPALLSAKNPNVREGWTFAGAGFLLLVIGSMVPDILAGETIVYQAVRLLPGVSLGFRVDSLGLLFALVSSSLWIVTTAYSIGYMRGLNEHSQTRYYSFFALSLSAAVGVAFSANLLTLYLFYEMLSLATYPLVTHHQDSEAKSGGRKYLVYILGTSITLVLPAMIVCYALTGTLEFGPGGILDSTIGQGMTLLLLLLFVFGFAKAGVMPFHAWLPAAMIAPTPVSALLHAVAVVKVGAFSILRVVTGILGVDHLAALNLGTVLAWIASFTIIVSSLIALSQDGLKRRLAFSTIGQLSYIILGAALLTPAGLTGGFLHIAMHAFGKITLFMCAGAIFVATGKTRISQMNGLGRRMPWTMLAFLAGSLSVIGLPPLGGFISKWNLLLGTLEPGREPFLVVLLVSSFLNAAYFLPIVYRAFFCSPHDKVCQGPRDEGPLWAYLPPVLTALASIALFFYPQPFLALARAAARSFLGGG